jgi:hypothetical protein
MYLLLFIFLINECYSYRVFRNKVLNLNQLETIKKLIINTDKNSQIRIKLNKIIYLYYDDWSYNKAIEFKKFHYYKCKNIPLIELYSYSNFGLCKAIKNYNGKSNFTNYANFYVTSELYKGLTELYPISIFSKKERSTKKKIEISSKEKNVKTTFVGDNNWLYEKLDIKNNYYSYKNYWEYNYENYEDFWEKMNLLTPFEIYLIKTVEMDGFLLYKSFKTHVSFKKNSLKKCKI